MILHKLTLNNVGLFRGKQTLHLTPRGTGPVILIGGKNGSGKTTLLDAVRLCLYGRRALGNRVSLGEYHEHLSTMIHRGSDSVHPLNHAAVSLEFEYAHGGEVQQYQVERAWQQDRRPHGAVKENLTITKDNWLDTEFEVEHWQDHINELIPRGVSQFFFFDGEDIQKLADDSSHDLFLAESIKALLGLNFVERLQSDLRIYANRLVKRGSPEPARKEIEAVESEITTLRSSIADADVHTEFLRTQIERLETQIARQESRIAAEGGGYARKRESLKLKQAQSQAEIEALENRIREMCAGLFPFSLAPSLLRRVKERLLKEIQLDEWEAKKRVLATQNTEILDKVASEAFWADLPLSPEQISDIHVKLAPLLTTGLEPPEELRGFEKIRDRSPSEYRKLIGWIDACLNEVPQQVREVSNALKTAKSELHEVELALQRAPSDEMLKPLLEKLSALNQTLGQLRKQAQDTDKSIRALEYQLAEAERKLAKLLHAQQLGQAHIQRQERVSNVQSVLSAYTTQLTQAKIASLASAVVDGFNQLSHKPDRIQRVDIDPHTFVVTLYDTYNRALSKEELSAGEKQMYTTALLWGLAQTSGKALPMILDTPLGRLDSSHRQLLVERYFPHASHQVVLLSTDTEVDAHSLPRLLPHLSHTLHLAYQKTEACTTIEDGYFSAEVR